MKSAGRESSTTRIFFLVIRSSLHCSATVALHHGEGEGGELGQGSRLAEDAGGARGRGHGDRHRGRTRRTSTARFQPRPHGLGKPPEHHHLARAAGPASPWGRAKGLPVVARGPKWRRRLEFVGGKAVRGVGRAS